MSERKLKVKKLGVRISPPFMVMIYHDGEKWRQRKMPVRNFGANSACSQVAREMKKRHAPYLTVVPTVRVEKLLRFIQESIKLYSQGKKVDRKTLKKKIDAEFKVDAEKDLNKVSPEELRRQKELMDDSFEKASVAPGDEGFVYDKRSDFASGNNQEKSSWDDDDDEGGDDDHGHEDGGDELATDSGGDDDERRLADVEAAEDGEAAKSDDDW